MDSLQNRLLKMLTWLTRYLEANNLRYYAVCGTLLGAVRHHGFIPWDDDIDIAMPRKDYEELIAQFSQPIEHYVVESPKGRAPDYVYGFAKFYDMNTTMTEDLRKNITRGVYIDIFPLDGIGNTLDESHKNYKAIDRTNMMLAMRVAKIRKDRKWWKNAAVVVGRLLPLSPKKLAQKADRLCAAHDYDECEYVGNLMSTYRSREIIEKRIYGTPTRYEFEGLPIFGPELYDEYLTTLYHDWQKLPPPDKRRSAHDLIDVDFDTPYGYKNYEN